jgi:hypothetical protein
MRFTWTDRGTPTAAFAETSPAHNDEFPSVLVELAFHDEANDAAYLKEPGFRLDASRAMARGIVRYFADSDGADARTPARCPRALAALAPLLPPLTRVDLLVGVKLKLRLARVDDAMVGLVRAMLVDIETALALR